MCGIAGFVGARAISPSARAAMLAALADRGPDAQHVVCWNSALTRTEQEATAALLHTRLSIRDLRAVAGAVADCPRRLDQRRPRPRLGRDRARLRGRRGNRDRREVPRDRRSGS